MIASASRKGKRADLIWAGLAILAVASVLFLNGRPLFYFDTLGYYDQGTVALQQLGLATAPVAVDGDVAAGAVSTVSTVDGSRSPFYSLLAGIFAQIGAFEGLLAFNAVALFLALYLVARLVQRRHAPDVSRVQLLAIPVIAASLGSLPFYAAYLMPDLMTPVLLIVLAALTAFARDMTWGELILAFLVGSVAIISHLSHFAIGGVLIPVVAALSALAERRRWWLAPLVASAIFGVAVCQHYAFRVVAEKTVHSDVVIKPFLTARLIQDGPGYDWLEANCPSEAIASCKLWDALQWSDDPYRLTASHITFERSKRLGSFLLMTPEDQKAVADDQINFYKSVLKDMPFRVAFALLRNVFLQSAMVSIDMTVQDDQIVARNAAVTGTLTGPLSHGRLSADHSWIDGFTRMQEIYYAAALVIALALVLSRGLPTGLRVFGLMLLLGVLANALVCSGASQPASRYGARVVWLVPFLAALLMTWIARAPDEDEL